MSSSKRDAIRAGVPVHARRVPVEVVRALEEEGRRARRTLDNVVTQVLVYWYEDMLAAEEKRKRELLRAAGVDGVRVG